MIASGWYENREIILDSLPHHLEELPDNVKKFLREIWCLTISYDAYYRSNGRSTTAKTILSLPTPTIRQLRPLGASPRLDNRRR